MKHSYITPVQNRSLLISEDTSGSREVDKLLDQFSITAPSVRNGVDKPNIPKMANLPPSSLRLFQPAFYSTGMDCFGPFAIKIGRRNEKRRGIIYKCLTTKALYIDLLSQADTDSFLMSLRRFIARRGKPHQLISDQGTNFKGGDHELKEAFNNIHPQLQTELAKQQINFQYNPPNSPHFGGSWERD